MLENAIGLKRVRSIEKNTKELIGIPSKVIPFVFISLKEKSWHLTDIMVVILSGPDQNENIYRHLRQYLASITMSMVMLNTDKCR